MNYESGRNDNDAENIEVDEPVQRIHSVGTRVKPETYGDPDPLYTGEYLEETAPKRKSPNKKQAGIFLH